jgi:multisubunit Na+/H+ antiporter MnhB subunit
MYLIYLGIFELLYGISKISVALILYFLPYKYIQEIPFVRNFFPKESDKTLAGKMYEYVLIIVGIYSIISALIIFEMIPNIFIHRELFGFVLLIVLGIFLTIFYYLVLYTNLPISKNNDNRKYYLILGLIGGIIMISIPIIIAIIYYSIPVLKKLDPVVKSSILLVTFIIVSSSIEYVYIFLKDNIHIYTSSYIPAENPGFPHLS